MTERERPSVRAAGAWLLAAGSGVAGTAVVLALTWRNGSGLSIDSVNYLSAADSLWTTGTFQGFLAGSHLADFPPLYPLLLVPGEVLDAPLTAARIIGAVAFGLLAAAGAVGSARIAPGLAYPLAGTIAVLVGTPVAGVFCFIWSDGPFALAIAAFLLVASRIESRRDAVVVSGLLAGAVTLVRYVGVTTIPVGLLAISLWSGRRGRDVPLFLLLSAIGPLVWVVRNLIVTSTLAGERQPASEGLESAVRATASTIGTWVSADHPTVGLAAVTFVTLATLPMLRRLPLTRLEAVALAFCAVYVALLILSVARVSLDPIDDRLLAPVYVPLVWLAVATTRRLLLLAAGRSVRWPAVAAVIAVAAVWTADQGARLPDLADAVDGSSIAHVPRWNTEEQQLVRRLSPRIYSNAPDAMYLGSGARVRFSPRRVRYRSDAALDELTPLRERVASEGAAVLVWFPELRRSSVYAPAELARHLALRRMRSTSDAELYAVCAADEHAGACRL